MTLLIQNIKLPLSADESSLPSVAARTLGIKESAVQTLKINRVSLDARKKNDINFIYTVSVSLDSHDEARILKRNIQNVSCDTKDSRRTIAYGERVQDKPIVVVGLGPAGLFAAYTLAKHGYDVIAVERGKQVEERKSDVERFFSGGGLSANSNVMFGEGGAGAFSDGKLTTRIKDPRANEVVNILADFGAPQEIRVMAKPHIGTDILTVTVANMRKDIERMGGVVRFNTKLNRILSNDGTVTAAELETESGKETIQCCEVILASGLGAVDTYEMLQMCGVEISPKPFAAGVRIEHPREIIDKSQYGEFANHPRLGAAEYHLADKSGGRGVYTFCMCPGGVVIGSSSADGEVVTNGMSYYARDGENSNAAVVVQIDPSDYPNEPLGGLKFRASLERAAYELGGGGFTAPAQRVGDYLKKAKAGAFCGVKPTYRPQVRAAQLDKCLPDFMANAIREGISAFGRRIRGYDMGDAVITAVESRTSAPVRINRTESGEATMLHGLYPVGEGAGYAGGIVSAAVDGMRAAETIIAKYKPR